jgi:7-cyano-7-deazaguanine synthase
MSGGLDSTTLAYKAISDGYTIIPVNIKYGQKNVVEMKAFKNVVTELSDKFPNRIMKPIVLNLQAMLDTSLALYQEIRDSGKVKETTAMEFYTPSRNLVFSTLASMIGEIATIASGETEVRIGLGVHKHSDVYPRDYWDISPEFVNRLNHLFELNEDIKVEMYAPYANHYKSEIVQDAITLGVPLAKTWTCYQPVEFQLEKSITKFSPCLKCEACLEREAAGKQANYSDINDYHLYFNNLDLVYSNDYK